MILSRELFSQISPYTQEERVKKKKITHTHTHRRAQIKINATYSRHVKGSRDPFNLTQLRGKAMLRREKGLKGHAWGCGGGPVRVMAFVYERSAKVEHVTWMSEMLWGFR